jgi:hypothetical protein
VFTSLLFTTEIVIELLFKVTVTGLSSADFSLASPGTVIICCCLMTAGSSIILSIPPVILQRLLYRQYIRGLRDPSKSFSPPSRQVSGIFSVQRRSIAGSLNATTGDAISLVVASITSLNVPKVEGDSPCGIIRNRIEYGRNSALKNVYIINFFKVWFQLVFLDIH